MLAREAARCKEAPGASKEKFEIFYTKPSRLVTGSFFPKKDRLSVHDPSATGEFRVEMERRREDLEARRVLASSKEGSQVSGTWTPAKPSKRKVLVGHCGPFWVEEGRFGEALEDYEPGKHMPKIKDLVIGDPAPDTEYRIRLVAKKGWMRGVRVD